MLHFVGFFPQVG